MQQLIGKLPSFFISTKSFKKSPNKLKSQQPAQTKPAKSHFGLHCPLGVNRRSWQKNIVTTDFNLDHFVSSIFDFFLKNKHLINSL
jgi:hypothetical protein